MPQRSRSNRSYARSGLYRIRTHMHGWFVGFAHLVRPRGRPTTACPVVPADLKRMGGRMNSCSGAILTEQRRMTRLAHPPLGRPSDRFVGVERELLKAPPTPSGDRCGGVLGADLRGFECECRICAHDYRPFGRLSFFSRLASRFSLSDLPGFLADGFWGDFSGTVAPRSSKGHPTPQRRGNVAGSANAGLRASRGV